MAVSSKVASWVHKVLQPQYEHSDVAYTHICDFLSRYLAQGFRIRTAVHTLYSGVSQLLVNIYGNVGSGPHAIAIQIWLPFNYPYAVSNATEPNGAPIVYASAPRDSHLYELGSLDSQGRFFCASLLEWLENWRPGTDNTQDLLQLMGAIQAEVTPKLSRQSPEISSRSLPISLGPELPAKPPLSRDSTGSRVPAEVSGPPLPKKPWARDEELPLRQMQDLSVDPQHTGVKSKYFSPLPLPLQNDESDSLYSGRDSSESSINSGRHSEITSPHRMTSPGRVISPCRVVSPGGTRLPASLPALQEFEYRPTQRTYGDSHLYRSTRTPPSVSGGSPVHANAHHSASPAHQLSARTRQYGDANTNKSSGRPETRPDTVADLMDQTNPLSHEDPRRDAVLNEISLEIRRYLESGNSLNRFIGEVDENGNRVQALYNQLQSHLSKAKRNIALLDKDIETTKSNIAELSNYNQLLLDLASRNSRTSDAIAFGDSVLPLSEYLVPGTPALAQLFNLSAETLSYNDTFFILDHSWASPHPVINDDNMEACVKAVRAMAREQFWNVAAKTELASRM